MGWRVGDGPEDGRLRATFGRAQCHKVIISRGSGSQLEEGIIIAVIIIIVQDTRFRVGAPEHSGGGRKAIDTVYIAAATCFTIYNVDILRNGQHRVTGAAVQFSHLWCWQTVSVLFLINTSKLRGSHPMSQREGERVNT